jgi:hypothetical protein
MSVKSERVAMPITNFTANENDAVQKAARELRFKYGVKICISKYAYDNIDPRFIQIVANEALSGPMMTTLTLKASEDARKYARSIRFNMFA